MNKWHAHIFLFQDVSTQSKVDTVSESSTVDPSKASIHSSKEENTDTRDNTIQKTKSFETQTSIAC